MEVINLLNKFKLFSDQWSPKIIGALNGQYVKLAKVEGPFVWHDHKEEDELFLVVKGTLEMHLESGIKILNEGEMLIVPRGVTHKPVAQEECWILLFEPASTKNTGDLENDRTVTQLEQI